jgi:hypothetical protein
VTELAGERDRNDRLVAELARRMAGELAAARRPWWRRWRGRAG